MGNLTNICVASGPGKEEAKEHMRQIWETVKKAKENDLEINVTQHFGSKVIIHEFKIFIVIGGKVSKYNPRTGFIRCSHDNYGWNWGPISSN